MTEQKTTLFDKLLAKTPDHAKAIAAYKAAHPDHVPAISPFPSLNRPWSEDTTPKTGYFYGRQDGGFLYSEDGHVGYKKTNPIAAAVIGALLSGLFYMGGCAKEKLSVGSGAEFYVPKTAIVEGKYKIQASRDVQAKHVWISMNDADKHDLSAPYIRLSSQNPLSGSKEISIATWRVAPESELATFADYNKLDVLYRKVFTDANRKVTREY
ncbi:MAG TPA: hypothetical protein VK158_06615 [Acidobacteriota bacterium]|nr:hypothetical protein [Acidobacteriota bacterium]